MRMESTNRTEQHLSPKVQLSTHCIIGIEFHKNKNSIFFKSEQEKCNNSHKDMYLCNKILRETILFSINFWMFSNNNYY